MLKLARVKIGALLLLVGALAVVWLTGAMDLLSLERAEGLRSAVLASGAVAPALFVLLYIVGGLAFVPGAVLTLLGGVIFGPWRGLIYSSIGSTLGACIAFLIARYAVRDLVEAWTAGNPTLRRLDALVSRHGGRVVMFTRLVPVLPFGVLNYAYGLTGIPFMTYAVTSWVCMLPATAVLAFTAGAVTAGTWDPRRTLQWLALGVVALFLVTLVPRWLAHAAQRSERCGSYADCFSSSFSPSRSALGPTTTGRGYWRVGDGVVTSYRHCCPLNDGMTTWNNEIAEARGLLVSPARGRNLRFDLSRRERSRRP